MRSDDNNNKNKELPDKAPGLFRRSLNRLSWLGLAGQDETPVSNAKEVLSDPTTSQDDINSPASQGIQGDGVADTQADPVKDYISIFSNTADSQAAEQRLNDTENNSYGYLNHQIATVLAGILNNDDIDYQSKQQFVEDCKKIVAEKERKIDEAKSGMNVSGYRDFLTKTAPSWIQSKADEAATTHKHKEIKAASPQQTTEPTTTLGPGCK